MGCRASQYPFNKIKARIAFKSASADWWRDHSKITKCYQHQFANKLCILSSMQMPSTHEVTHLPWCYSLLSAYLVDCHVWLTLFRKKLRYFITSQAGFPIGSACPMSQITQDKLHLSIGSTCQSLNKHKSSCASWLVGRAKCLNSHASSCASLVAACSKCLNKSNVFTFRLIVGFIQHYQSQLQQDLVDFSLPNAFSIAGKLDSS